MHLNKQQEIESIQDFPPHKEVPLGVKGQLLLL